MNPAVVMPIKNTTEQHAMLTDTALTSLLNRNVVDVVLVERLATSDQTPYAPWDNNIALSAHIVLPPDDQASTNGDANMGFDVAQHELKKTHIVYTANDIFVTDNRWLQALTLPWDQISDCGISTLASSDLRIHPGPLIMEGVYGPFMMFESHRRFDTDNFPDTFGDTDLIMTAYGEGKRSYRNYSVLLHHAPHTTLKFSREHEDAAKQRFMAKHNDNKHLYMYRAFVQGIVV